MYIFARQKYISLYPPSMPCISTKALTLQQYICYTGICQEASQTCFFVEEKNIKDELYIIDLNTRK